MMIRNLTRPSGSTCAFLTRFQSKALTVFTFIMHYIPLPRRDTKDFIDKMFVGHIPVTGEETVQHLGIVLKLLFIHIFRDLMVQFSVKWTRKFIFMFSQVDAQSNTEVRATTLTTTNSSLNGGGLMALPGLLSIILPTALLAYLLQHLHC